MDSSKELRRLEKVFRKIPHASAAMIYGSAVRGDDLLNKSDLDVAVFLEGDYMTPSESYYHIAGMPKKYDVTPHSVGDAKGIVSDFFNAGFYDHFINYHKVIFDDADVMKDIKLIGKRMEAFEEKVGPNREHVANVTYYVLRTRRGCINLGRWLPKYGPIEPVARDLGRFKSSLMGVMREGIQASGQRIAKGSDYKECVISKFANIYPKFWNKDGENEPQFQMRDYGSKDFFDTPPYISSHLLNMGGTWHNLRKRGIESALKQANECRKLIEFAAACVNDELMKKISS